MTPTDKINIFFKREDLSKTDKVLKEKCIELDKAIAKAKKELDVLTKDQNAKQAEAFALSQQLEGLLQVIISLDEIKEESTENVPDLD